MRLSICHYSFHRRWEAERWTLDRLMDEAKLLGYNSIDVHTRLLGAADGAAERIQMALKRSGMILSGLSLANSFSSEHSSEVRAQIEKVKQWLVVAAQLNAPVSRIFGGSLPAQQRLDTQIKRQKTKQIVDALNEITRYAERLNITLALENHGGLPCTGEEQVEIIRLVNSPALKATIDVGNYMHGGQEGHIGTMIAAPYAAYVHFKDFKKVTDLQSPSGWRLQPCGLGEGDVIHKACLDALRNAGYKGTIALEYEGVEMEQTGVPKSTAFMHNIMREYID